MDAPARVEVRSAGSGPRRADPCVFVVFGASGDLTRRLLVPALCNLSAADLLPDQFAVIGVARREMSDEAFRRDIRAALTASAPPPASSDADTFVSRFSYVGGDFDDAGTYARLKTRLADVERRIGTGGNALFYLATPPDVFGTVAQHLGQADLATEQPKTWRRIVVEKPFGTDLASARALNKRLLAIFADHQIFRIDHYLGKETVQNIMVLRFANGLFEPLWNRHHIDHVQITVAESLSVEARGKFYDGTGALRDMVPNHLFQLLTLTAMEPPIRFEADAVRDEKRKAIAATRPLDAEVCLADVVRGQYTAGTVLGQPVPAFREAQNVAPNSLTESYVAMRLMIDNWRWAGVPFFIRTGKALAARRSEIAIEFKQAPLAIFRDMPIERLAENFLVLHLQPDEGASLQFNVKVPGPTIRIDGVRMDFHYEDYFGATLHTGYETLLYDAMTGDATLFQRADEIEAAWQVVQPILDAWTQDQGRTLAFYPAGTEGPKEADALLARHGRRWRPIGPTGR